ncbi:hypothetical protein cyc_05167 [Cyclospora cayetanensis]|uniref:Peptidase S9 prolyl oligopeptidase catalytic domain-containing protein n=1 Tax=Cyclospora cayetanensis TaxID=88456 RepID=A0A1D3DA86_9EIME|nr:hypothetical protein cyc_05167 [Cyclospora cayetanensis]
MCRRIGGSQSSFWQEQRQRPFRALSRRLAPLLAEARAAPELRAEALGGVAANIPSHAARERRAAAKSARLLSWVDCLEAAVEVAALHARTSVRQSLQRRVEYLEAPLGSLPAHRGVAQVQQNLLRRRKLVREAKPCSLAPPPLENAAASTWLEKPQERMEPQRGGLAAAGAQLGASGVAAAGAAQLFPLLQLKGGRRCSLEILLLPRCSMRSSSSPRCCCKLGRGTLADAAAPSRTAVAVGAVVGAVVLVGRSRKRKQGALGSFADYGEKAAILNFPAVEQSIRGGPPPPYIHPAYPGVYTRGLGRGAPRIDSVGLGIDGVFGTADSSECIGSLCWRQFPSSSRSRIQMEGEGLLERLLPLAAAAAAPLKPDAAEELSAAAETTAAAAAASVVTAREEKALAAAAGYSVGRFAAFAAAAAPAIEATEAALHQILEVTPRGAQQQRQQQAEGACREKQQQGRSLQHERHALVALQKQQQFPDLHLHPDLTAAALTAAAVAANAAAHIPVDTLGGFAYYCPEEKEHFESLRDLLQQQAEVLQLPLECQEEAVALLLEGEEQILDLGVWMLNQTKHHQSDRHRNDHRQQQDATLPVLRSIRVWGHAEGLVGVSIDPKGTDRPILLLRTSSKSCGSESSLRGESPHKSSIYSASDAADTPLLLSPWEWFPAAPPLLDIAAFEFDVEAPAGPFLLYAAGVDAQTLAANKVLRFVFEPSLETAPACETRTATAIPGEPQGASSPTLVMGVLTSTGETAALVRRVYPFVLAKRELLLHSGWFGLLGTAPSALRSLRSCFCFCDSCLRRRFGDFDVPPSSDQAAEGGSKLHYDVRLGKDRRYLFFTATNRSCAYTWVQRCKLVYFFLCGPEGRFRCYALLHRVLDAILDALAPAEAAAASKDARVASAATAVGISTNRLQEPHVCLRSPQSQNLTPLRLPLLLLHSEEDMREPLLSNAAIEAADAAGIAAIEDAAAAAAAVIDAPLPLGGTGLLTAAANADAHADSVRMLLQTPLHPALSVHLDVPSCRLSVHQQQHVVLLGQERLQRIREACAKLAAAARPEDSSSQSACTAVRRHKWHVEGMSGWLKESCNAWRHRQKARLWAVHAFASRFAVEVLYTPSRDGLLHIPLTLVARRETVACFQQRRAPPLSLRLAGNASTATGSSLASNECDGLLALPFTPSLLHRPLPAGSAARPLLLQVYGAYKEPLAASFDAGAALLLQNGWILAFAHVRGGGETPLEGEAEGRGHRRRQAAQDLVDILSFLQGSGVSHPKATAVKATSAGAVAAAALLLAGRRCAALSSSQQLSTQQKHRPWMEREAMVRCLLLENGFIDVLSAMEDPLLPLTQLEAEEWGTLENQSSSTSAAAWRDATTAGGVGKTTTRSITWEEEQDTCSEATDPWRVWSAVAKEEAADARCSIAAYCCYETLQKLHPQVGETAALPSPFPSVLLTTSLTDSRTPPWHAAKLAAHLNRLQQHTPQARGQQPAGAADVHLRCLVSGSGHYGHMDGQKHTNKVAEDICFLLSRIPHDWFHHTRG